MTARNTARFFGTLGFATLGWLLLTAGTTASARDAQRQRGAHPPRATQPHTRTTERQRTENGHKRTDTWTRREWPDRDSRCRRHQRS